MTEKGRLRILFVINPASGQNITGWLLLITDYRALSGDIIEFFILSKDGGRDPIIEEIRRFQPQKVIAVGGDGTIKLVASCLIGENIPLGILPAGSSNGLAKELGISNIPKEAFRVIDHGCSKRIHVININNQTCVHLSDIGFNAYAMKSFQTQQGRGKWGYLKAYLSIFRTNPLMEVEMIIDEKPVKIKAAMIVIANATTYGTGAVINPIGKLNDNMFEVIAVKKISIRELFKMAFSHTPYDLNKTEVFQTHMLSIQSVKRVHFQVDGEYLGMVNEVKAFLIKDALDIIIPAVVE